MSNKFNLCVDTGNGYLSSGSFTVQTGYSTSGRGGAIMLLVGKGNSGKGGLVNIQAGESSRLTGGDVVMVSYTALMGRKRMNDMINYRLFVSLDRWIWASYKQWKYSASYTKFWKFRHIRYIYLVLVHNTCNAKINYSDSQAL